MSFFKDIRKQNNIHCFHKNTYLNSLNVPLTTLRLDQMKYLRESHSRIQRQLLTQTKLHHFPLQ